MSTPDDPVSMQNAARITGVPVHTLRWYERVGLVRDVTRTPSGRRHFSSRHLEWIGIVRALRATGMPVATLRLLAERHSSGRTRETAALLRAHRAQVVLLIARLSHSLAVLDEVERTLLHPQDEAGAARSAQPGSHVATV